MRSMKAMLTERDAMRERAMGIVHLEPEAPPAVVYEPRPYEPPIPRLHEPPIPRPYEGPCPRRSPRWTGTTSRPSRSWSFPAWTRRTSTSR